MSVFVVAVFFLLITPGPGVLSTAGVGASFGKQAGYRYVLGLFIGTNLVALAVVTGLASIVFTVPALRTVLLIRDALLLQAINPKAYVVNTTLFTGFEFTQMSLWQETIWKFILINAVWVPIHLLWLRAGIGLQELQLSQRTQRTINILMALSLLIVVALAAIMSDGKSVTQG